MPYSPEDVIRIRKAAKLTQQELAEKLGLARESINRLEKGTLPISKIMEAVLQSLDSDIISQNSNRIPFYDTVAIAGTRHGADMMPITDPVSTIDVGDLLRESECAISIYNNSMEPYYPSGCVVGLREVRDGYIDFGSVYVIETEDNRLIKRILEGSTRDSYMLWSFNEKEYKPSPISKKAIRRIYRVVGMIRRSDNSFIFGKK